MCPIICTMPLSISIHALLAESDAYQSGLLLGICHFYPRSPCGERPIGPQIIADRVGISIHALLAESDIVGGAGNNAIRISIHALLAESDRLFFMVFDLFRNISIHALLAESDEGPAKTASE